MRVLLFYTAVTLLSFNSLAQLQEKSVSIKPSKAPIQNASVQSVPAKNNNPQAVLVNELNEVTYTLTPSLTLDPNITPTVVPVIPKVEGPDKNTGRDNINSQSSAPVVTPTKKKTISENTSPK